MSLEHSVEMWINQHLSSRKGERHRRLVKGLGYSENMFLEKVWFPIFGQLDHLHPEYEVTDFKDSYRYIDFAYLHHWLRLAIEIDPFGTHHRDMSRDEFSDERDRQNDLIIDGWKVIRFSLDRIRDNPRACQRRLQNLIGKYLVEWQRLKEMSLEEREIIRMARRVRRDLKVRDVKEWLHVSSPHAKKLLFGLVSKKELHPTSGTQRITAFRLVSNQYDCLLD
ncbi:MAG: DNA-binding response regulator [Paenibacillaceae bacterium]